MKIFNCSQFFGVSPIILFVIPLYNGIEQDLMDEINVIKKQENCSELDAYSILIEKFREKIDRIQIQKKTIKTKIYLWYLNQKLGVLLSLSIF